MFQYRSSDFSPSVDAIQKHLVAVEKELEKIGRTAGRRGGAAASAAGEQIGDALFSLVSDMIDRFRAGGRLASDRAARAGGQALQLGSSYGNSALQRISAKVEDRPLITLGVAIGVGILIGAAVLGNVSRR
jgi:ElaB/YqjD/DUF883 family membrane-anchored ribosome-binding protein